VSSGVGSAAGMPGLSYADSVRSRAPFEVIGRPLRPSVHQHHHLQPSQQQQYEGAAVADNLRSADDVSSTVSRLRSLQAELQSRDNVTHGLANVNDQQQVLARKDKVDDMS